MTHRKIVAISGSGRTGSTLLSLLLSQHKTIFNLGQLRDLWAAWAADAPCRRGQPLRQCAVYSAVVREVCGASPDAGLQQARSEMKAFFRDTSRLRDWGEPGAVEPFATRHAPFLARLAAVLDALQRTTGATGFVDASKSPEMALALGLTTGTDLYVLNLVRDPRAIAVSWSKRRKRAFAGREFSRTWAQRQRVLTRWSRALGPRFIEVRYEDFAADARAKVDDWRDRRHWLQHALALLATHPHGARYARGGGSRA